jgi:hypothetical protein
MHHSAQTSKFSINQKYAKSPIKEMPHLGRSSNFDRQTRSSQRRKYRRHRGNQSDFVPILDLGATAHSRAAAPEETIYSRPA